MVILPLYYGNCLIQTSRRNSGNERVKLGSSPEDRDPVRVELQSQLKAAPASSDAEPVAQVLHVYAYVGVEPNTDNESPTLHEEENEARPFVVKSGSSEAVDDWRKSFHLQPAERQRWWSSHPRPVGQVGIALIHGAVCDYRATILLDSGSDTSILSLELARRLRLKLSYEERLKVKGIGGVTTYVTAKARIKLTLGMSVVYYMEVWCGNIGEGMECLLGMDFWVSAGVRLSAYDGLVRLPDEESIPLISPGARPRFPKRTLVCPADDIIIAGGRSAVVRIVYGKDHPDMVVWLCRGKHWLTSLVVDNQGRPEGIRVVNISSEPVDIRARTAVGHLVEQCHLPHGSKCVRAGSTKYEEWQQLIYENSHSRQFARRQDSEERLYLASLPPAVERPVYPTPTKLLARGESLRQVQAPEPVSSPAPTSPQPARAAPSPTSDMSSNEPAAPAAQVSVAMSVPSPKPASPTVSMALPSSVKPARAGSKSRVATRAKFAHEPESGYATAMVSQRAGDATAQRDATRLAAKLKFLDVRGDPGPEVAAGTRLAFTFKAIAEAVAQGALEMTGRGVDEEAAVFYHEGTDFMPLDELRDQLAMIPDFDKSPAQADMAEADVGEPDENTPEEIAALRSRFDKHKTAFMSSGNALPPPARGVVCDIEIEPGVKPIAQRPRPIKAHLLRKVYELLKALLEVGIIEYSDSEWASPIDVVMKKNGLNIRLCIDFRLVNTLIKLMRYPLPLIDQLLDDFEAVMWLLSLDMASGFWAVLMTQRAKHVSAFVCPLGHFQWVRMPFGLKNAPLIYQQVIRSPSQLMCTT